MLVCGQIQGIGIATYSGDISQRVLLAGQNLPQDSTHDLSTAGLGEVRDDDDGLWCCEWANALAHLKDEVLLQLVGDLVTVLDRDEGVDGLAGEFISDANNGGLGDSSVLNESGLDLGGGETVTGDVDDVVDASADPVVAVMVTSGSVTSELD